MQTQFRLPLLCAISALSLIAFSEAFGGQTYDFKSKTDSFEGHFHVGDPILDEATNTILQPVTIWGLWNGHAIQPITRLVPVGGDWLRIPITEVSFWQDPPNGGKKLKTIWLNVPRSGLDTESGGCGGIGLEDSTGLPWTETLILVPRDAPHE